MDITVTGKGIDIGDSLREHITDAVTSMTNKYFDRAVNASVVLTQEGGRISADCHIHLPTGLFLNAAYEGHEAYSSFDQALEKMDKRLRRYKRRLKQHHSNRKDRIESYAAQYHVVHTNNDVEEEPDTFEPVTVADMEVHVQTLTVSDAVMQLELSHRPAMMFRNAAHGGLNMVYRREDGHIGWVDPIIDNEN